jgi:prefoldin subunit 5
MEKAKYTSKALYELSESYHELHQTIKSTTQTSADIKKLWREGNKSNLIKIGMACIMFPDPSPVTEIIGAGFLVAGAVQKGIQKRTLYVSDFKKNISSIQKEIRATQDCLQY